jgi:hypothetical protein
VGDAYWTGPEPVDLYDLFFKNLTGGSNTVITVVGTLLPKKNRYGIDITKGSDQ